MVNKEYQELVSEINYYHEVLGQIEASVSNVLQVKNDLVDFSKEGGDDVLAPIASGVYVEAKLKNRDLFVNVGSDVIVKKSVEETLLILDAQLDELLKDREVLSRKLESLYVSLQGVSGSVKGSV